MTVSITRAQKVDQKQLAIASRRSANATKVINDVAALPANERIPKPLLDKAKAIAVFPDTKEISLLYQKARKGYGVVSRRLETGWSTPAFYGFGMQKVKLTGLNTDNSGIIMLIMTERALKGFANDWVALTGSAGPVGELTPDKEKELTGVNVIIYSLTEGKLSGLKVGGAIPSLSRINSDNNINNPIFGLKARDVMWSKTPIEPPSPEIGEFQKALINLLK